MIEVSRVAIAARTLSVAALVGFTGACGLFENRVIESYTLTHINGNALPAAYASVQVAGGGTHETQAVQGALRIFEDGSFDKEKVWRGVLNGVPDTSTTTSRWTGRVQRGDTLREIHFTDERGAPTTFVYVLSDSGRVLRGIEYLGGAWPASYEYRRP
jgi:hypothetical protein